MKKKIGILIFALSIICCAGCSENNEPREKNGKDIRFYVDKETGVNYFIYRGGYAGGMTVRLNADGTPYVSKTTNREEK